jgi:cystathionine gamma-lyase
VADSNDSRTVPATPDLTHPPISTLHTPLPTARTRSAPTAQYGRTNNPTRTAFERGVAAAEGGKHCLAFASGLSATVASLHLLRQGDHVVCIDDVYGGTQRFFRRIAAPTYGFTFDFVDFSVDGELEKAVKANPRTKLVWLETPTNPTLKISDIAAAAAIAHAAGAILVVDNTFMSPFFQRPLEHGADLVIHSVTKYSEARGGRRDWKRIKIQMRKTYF